MSKIAKSIVIALLLAGLSLSLTTGCFPVTGSQPPPNPAQVSDIFGEAWEIIFRDYVEQESLDADKLNQGAIRGMVEALDDPYSAYLDPEMYQLSLSDLEGEFEGIGAHVAVRDEQIVILAPISGSPAEKAGIRAGDKILEIDGKPTLEMSLA